LGGKILRTHLFFAGGYSPQSSLTFVVSKLSDIKLGLRRIDDKLDAMDLRINGTIDCLAGKVSSLRQEIASTRSGAG
jgi:hypothetical protein